MLLVSPSGCCSRCSFSLRFGGSLVVVVMEEEDMEVEVFEVVEVDSDYEYEAARFFDFTRAETEEEANEAELWFETARGYPPSPFVARMFLMEDIVGENVVVSPELESADDQGMDEQDETSRGSCRGLAFSDHVSSDVKNLSTKPTMKPTPRGSTLMKPTASQLAKQNLRSQAGHTRFQKLPANLNASFGVDFQASKRQKLDGGQLRKVGDVKRLNNLIHKVSKKDGNVHVVSHSRLRITIPVEPDLLTANRAHRFASIRKDESSARKGSTFKARPLNRKIFEAPTIPLSKKSTPRLPEFDVFHLKTTERAMQHNDAVKSNLPHQTYKDSENACAEPVVGRKNLDSRPKAVNTRNEDVHKAGHPYKARPLEKKIFTGKGNITKRPVTIPKEFEFQTDKRSHHNPLTELFSKLSLAPEARSMAPAPSKLPRRSCVSSKDSKENRGGIPQQNHNNLRSGDEQGRIS